LKKTCFFAFIKFIRPRSCTLFSGHHRLGAGHLFFCILTFFYRFFAKHDIRRLFGKLKIDEQPLVFFDFLHEKLRNTWRAACLAFCHPTGVSVERIDLCPCPLLKNDFIHYFMRSVGTQTPSPGQSAEVWALRSRKI
jgi:hypothetical protein